MQFLLNTLNSKTQQIVEVLVQLSLDIPPVLAEICGEESDYLTYFTNNCRDIYSPKKVYFSGNCLKGKYEDVNSFVWLAIAHQAYVERSILLDKKVIEDIEISVNAVFNLSNEPDDWLLAFHKRVDLYLMANTAVVEFLSPCIRPFDEILQVVLAENSNTVPELNTPEFYS